MEKIISSANKGIFSLLAVLFAMLISNVSYGQQHAIKTNVANFAIAGGSLHYEHVLGKSSSAQLGVFISALSAGDTKFSGFGIIPQYRLYPGKSNAPQGFFVAPLISYQTFSLETSADGIPDAEAKYSLIGVGLDIGKQWLIADVVSFELSLGLTFNSTNLSVETDGVSEDEFDTGGLGSVAPRLGLSLGYAF